MKTKYKLKNFVIQLTHFIYPIISVEEGWYQFVGTIRTFKIRILFIEVAIQSEKRN